MHKYLIKPLIICFALQCNAFAANMSLDAIKNRIAPIGQVYTETNKPPVKTVTQQQVTTTPPITQDPGKKIYDTYCVVCHGAGLAGAPKFGDSAAWKPRIAEGFDTLFDHALHGYKVMPPKGTCATCSDDDLKAAIKYMISHSGSSSS